jgi:CDP-diacylglycerol--serine O-phosphatidyltransferase
MMELSNDKDPAKKIIHPRGIYLLPNLFTTAALFAGFYSVISAMNGFFDKAAIAIFIAMVADTLDGRVARMTHTQTAFGAEYDSLSDMVAFGIAPALLVYSWSLKNLGKLGWLAAFIYAAATALRLARFNTQVEDQDKRYFQGLPCPAAAGVVAGAVWLGFAYSFDDGFYVALPLALLTVVTGSLMVSTIRYHSFKQLDLKGRVPFFVMLIPVLLLVAISIDPPEMLFLGFFVYALSGIVLTLQQLRQRRKGRAAKKVKN